MIRRLLQQDLASESSLESQRNRKRAVKLISIVISTFAGSWLPIQVILLCKALDVYPFSVAHISVQIGSHVLAYSNSCINPILYAFFSPPFRKAFLRLCNKGTDDDWATGRLTTVTDQTGQRQSHRLF